METNWKINTLNRTPVSEEIDLGRKRQHLLLLSKKNLLNVIHRNNYISSLKISILETVKEIVFSERVKRWKYSEILEWIDSKHETNLREPS